MLQERQVTKAKGVEDFDLSGLSAGAYILVFEHHGHNIAQEIIIKK